MTKRLFIDLTPQEEADIAGWVNFLRANPQYIGTTQASGLPHWQTKIVLADQSRARFDQISAQFQDAPPVPGGVADPNYGVPAGTFSGVVVDQPFHREDDQTRVRAIDPAYVLAVPLIVPDKPWNQTLILSMGVAEYGMPATIMQGCFSRLAGDFCDAMGTSRGEGTALYCLINVATEHLNPGDTLYLNMRMWSSDKQQVSTSVPHQVRIGGSWPR